MGKIAITTSSFGEYDKSPLALLEEKGYEILLNPHGRKLHKDEVVELCKDVVGIIAGTEQLDASVIEDLRFLKVISRCGMGMDNVDVKAAEGRGIMVLNTPDAPTLAVAELTIGMVLSLLRKTHTMDREVRQGVWKKKMGNLLSGKRAGIVGFGKIGRKVSELLRSFNCQLAYTDPVPGECPFGSKCLTMEELLGWADILFFHVSVKHRLIGEPEIASMRDGAWIVNASRGGIIDEAALHEALKKGKLSGAALDVFENEPYTGPLKELDNVILTPHIGSYAKEARIVMELQAAENLLKGLAR